jgi:hypothetical protein
MYRIRKSKYIYILLNMHYNTNMYILHNVQIADYYKNS